jgi:hypothetical protein
MSLGSKSDVALQILKKVKNHPKFKTIIKNVDPSNLDPNPWVSNFVMVEYSKDPEFCDSIAELLNEGKPPLFVAIMRSVNDPDALIAPFHAIHVDSRKSEKTLMVLDGDPEYSVFAKTEWTDFNFYEKIVIKLFHIVLYMIEKLRLRFMQSKISHRLPNNIKNKVYKKMVYKNIVNGNCIKFNNMLPHHSHPLPTKYSLLLQVVYN